MWRLVDKPTIVMNFQDDRPKKQPKTSQKRPFLDAKSAVERARRLEMQRNLFVVMRLGSAVVLSYWDAGFQPRCGSEDFLTAYLLLAAACCSLLLLAKTCSSPLAPKRWCKTLTG